MNDIRIKSYKIAFKYGKYKECPNISLLEQITACNSGKTTKYIAVLINSQVGTELVRGISGGEMRRTGIGMELIISPQVLFLDEPTTGLDASTASSVIQLLYE